MPWHFNSTPLEVGSVILPGNYGRIIKRAGWNHNSAPRESMLEHVRATEFAHLPSRFECSFFFDDLAQAHHYRNLDATRQIFMLLYEVEVMEPTATVHAADWRAVSPPGLAAPTLLNGEWARAYWRGDLFPPLNGVLSREILAVTPLRVTARLG